MASEAHVTALVVDESTLDVQGVMFVRRNSCVPIFDARHAYPVCSACGCALVGHLGPARFCQHCGAKVTRDNG